MFEFDDVGMVIRGKFMAKPGTQFTIRKEIYNRVKRVFNENGIDFAGLEEHDDLDETQKATVAAAAAEAAQQQIRDDEAAAQNAKK